MVYTPSLMGPHEDEEDFYKGLDQIIQTINNKLINLDKFNAKMETDIDNWDGVLGRHGMGKLNSNGLLLLSKCTEHNLCIANICSDLQTSAKQSQVHVSPPT